MFIEWGESMFIESCGEVEIIPERGAISRGDLEFADSSSFVMNRTWGKDTL